MLGFLTGVGRLVGSLGEDTQNERMLQSNREDCLPAEDCPEESFDGDRRRPDQRGLMLTMAGPQMILTVRPERGASVASAHFDHR